MMMSRIAFGTALVMAFGAAAPALADTVRCESDNGRERYCAFDTRGGVVLSTQLSSSGCYQGDTWGYDNRGVWVSGGCRADFSSGGYAGNNYHQGNDYCGNNQRKSGNDGAAVAIGLAAILGAAVIASAASKKNNSGGGYQQGYDAGCNAARADQRGNQGRYYGRHNGSYDSRSEQAFSAGYNQCWQGR